jgi:hypothetical protein
MAYFQISTGLRGCYLPDSIYIIRATTRRELKAAIADSVYNAEGEIVGLSKRAVSEFAALCWRERKGRHYLPYCLPYRFKYQSHYPYGIFVNNSSRAHYLADVYLRGES